jgi:hypothetical protein
MHINLVEAAHVRKHDGGGACAESAGGCACAEAWWRWRMRRNLEEAAHALKHGGGGASAEIWRRRRMR